MAKDDPLRTRLEEIAESDSKVSVERFTARDLADELKIDVGGSRNPIYRFSVRESDGSSFQAVAFTLILNAAIRPSSRAEALGQAIASGGEGFFQYNPFLLIYDFNDNRFMAVSAARLFGAFAKEASTKSIKASDTSFFSLSPHFDRRTITMYATVSGQDIWWCGDLAELTSTKLIAGLRHMQADTAAEDVPSIVAAVQARITEEPEASGEAVMSGVVVVLPDDERNDQAADIKIDPRIWRMVLTAIRSSPAVILVGPPGTGKTALLRQAIRELSGDPGMLLPGGVFHAPLWATPDESWTARDLVGGDTIAAGEIAFRPGWVLRAIAEDRWLVLDEANRADMDRIFGGLLTWLAGGRVSVGTANAIEGAKEVQLGWTQGASCREEAPDGREIRYLAGKTWRLLGTYNALDAQRVFRFGQALGRRFVRVPIPAVDPKIFRSILLEKAKGLDEEFIESISNIYEAHHASDETILGPALFLGMCEYVKAAVQPEATLGQDAVAPSIEAAEAANSPSIKLNSTQRETLAEAYLVHVGTWLAQLEDSDFDALRRRLIGQGVIEELEWMWISSMLKSLA